MNLLVEHQQNWKKPFFTIWTGQLFSLMGSQLVQFALVWWITKTTGSATLLATSSMVAIIPDVVFGPFVGALVDRWNRQKVMILADATIAFITFCLGLLFWFGLVQVWHVFLILFLRSLGGCFHWPAMQASTSMMVPEEHLARISGLNSSARGVMNIIAPPLGALLLNSIPLYAILGIDVVSALLAILPLLIVLIPQPLQTYPSKVVTPGVLISDVRAGLKYVWAWPGLMAILIFAVLRLTTIRNTHR